MPEAVEGDLKERMMAEHSDLFAMSKSEAFTVPQRVLFERTANLLYQGAAALSRAEAEREEALQQADRMLKAERLIAACRPEEFTGDAKAFMHWSSEALSAKAALAHLVSHRLSRASHMEEPK